MEGAATGEDGEEKGQPCGAPGPAACTIFQRIEWRVSGSKPLCTLLILYNISHTFKTQLLATRHLHKIFKVVELLLYRLN